MPRTACVLAAIHSLDDRASAPYGGVRRAFAEFRLVKQEKRPPNTSMKPTKLHTDFATYATEWETFKTMDNTILVAIIAAGVAVAGWFVRFALKRWSAKRDRDIQYEDASKGLIQDVLRICHRRAVYTRTHAQLDHKAMFSSLNSCRIELQKIVPRIENPKAQELAVNIIGQLDTIERSQEDFNTIDQAKLSIIDSLLKLSKTANLPFALPKGLTEEVFFSIEDANKPPTT